ncbi:saccharopine dehydrogenase [Spinellus fusiger]|nr:saccharopine dehydrogenase [Spinellus fusiger]
MPTDPATRPYSIVLYGATGFTGLCTAEYLLETGDKNLTWAMAGRSREKLQTAKDTLSERYPAARTVDLLVADINAPETLETVFSQTRVVMNMVGPFMQYGKPIVEACLKEHTHYVDISGEYTWIKYMVDHYHTRAMAQRTLLVPACGFDSVPSDLGVLMVVDYLRNTHGLPTANVKGSFTQLKGGVSGGSYASCLLLMGDKHLTTSQAVDPYLLSPVRGLATPTLVWPTYDAGVQQWQGMYVMAAINEKVVARSWGLKEQDSYGRLFRYRETVSMPWLVCLAWTGLWMTLGPLLHCMVKNERLLGWLLGCLPAAGSGPDREARKKGSFTMEFVGVGETQLHEATVRVRGSVTGFRDPGYGETCRMVAESAMCIVESMEALPSLGQQGGVLTPATAFGHVLIRRLTMHNGMLFQVKECE